MVSASSEARKQDCQSSQILLRSLYRAATLMKKRAQMIPAVTVAACILTIRGQKVILDSDLAAIYSVTPKRLNEQVKRNPRRFPPDFVFQLTKEEHAVLKSQIAIAKLGNLRSQFATSSSGYGGRRFLPYAFTENGAVMAANVLNSPQAVRMSVFVQIAAQWAPAPEPLRYAMGPCLAA